MWRGPCPPLQESASHGATSITELDLGEHPEGRVPGTQWLLTLEEALPIPGAPGVMGLGARALPELTVMIGRLPTQQTSSPEAQGLRDPLSCSQICSFGRDGGGGREVGPPTRAGGVTPKIAGSHSWQVGLAVSWERCPAADQEPQLLPKGLPPQGGLSFLTEWRGESRGTDLEPLEPGPRRQALRLSLLLHLLGTQRPHVWVRGVRG